MVDLAALLDRSRRRVRRARRARREPARRPTGPGRRPRPGWTIAPPDRPPRLDRPDRAAGRHRRGRRSCAALATAVAGPGPASSTAAPRSSSRRPPSCSPGGAPAGPALADALAGARPASRLPWFGTRDVAAVDGHRPDHGDLGARPGRGRRAGRHPGADRTACGTSRTSASVPSATASWRTAARRRRSRSGSSCRPRTARSGRSARQDAADRMTGPALDFCLLVTQRRHRADLALVGHRPGRRRVARRRAGVRRPARRRPAAAAKRHA